MSCQSPEPRALSLGNALLFSTALTMAGRCTPSPPHKTGEKVHPRSGRQRPPQAPRAGWRFPTWPAEGSDSLAWRWLGREHPGLWPLAYGTVLHHRPLPTMVTAGPNSAAPQPKGRWGRWPARSLPFPWVRVFIYSLISFYPRASHSLIPRTVVS